MTSNRHSLVMTGELIANRHNDKSSSLNNLESLSVSDNTINESKTTINIIEEKEEKEEKPKKRTRTNVKKSKAKVEASN